MKYKICFVFLLLILCFSLAHADNNIMIMVDTIRSSIYDVPVGFENDAALQGISNGFRLCATGDIAVSFIDGGFYLDTLSRNGQVPSSYPLLAQYSGIALDTVLIGTYILPPPWHPLPAGELEPIYYLPIQLIGSVGQVCIDSVTFIPPAGLWLWDDGHGAIFPTFNNNQGPHCIEYTYVCGDANRDGLVNVSDAVFLKNYIFVGGAAPNPYEAGDVNCDGTVNVSDVVWIMNFIFKGGRWPCDTDDDGVPDC